MATARRELREELGIRVVRVSQPLLVAADPDSMFRIHFVKGTIEGTPRASEHIELRWAEPADLMAMAFAPLDARFVREHVLGLSPPEK